MPDYTAPYEILLQQGDSELWELYRRFLRFHEQSGGELQEVIDDWLRSSDDAGLKGELLLAQVGAGDSQFKRYLKLVPEDQHSKVWQTIDRESSLSLYLKHAKKRGMEERLLTKAMLKSIEWQEITMPGGHRFEIARTPEIQIKWEAVMGSKPSRFKGENHPVERVSWNDAQKYIKKLNKSLGLEGCDGTPKSPVGCYRLPTEEEWEFASRGGSEGEYSFGDDPLLLSRYGWFDDNSNRKTHPVGLKRKNPYGLYDVHGNVSEWVQDPWSNHLQRGGDHLHSSSGSNRVIRGGSWGSYAWNLRSAFRYYVNPGSRKSFVGLRLVRTL